jgi:hypothetical protein
LKTIAIVTPRVTERHGSASKRKENTLTSSFTLCAIGCLLARLVMSSIDARGANGFTVSRSGESAITAGMTASEVRQQLGRPASSISVPTKK